MSDQDKPKPVAPPAATAAPKAPPKPAAPKPPPKPPEPKTAAGRAALEQHRVSPDWDAIAVAAIKATGVEAELKTLRARHQRLVDAGNQACDNISALFAALSQETP